MCRDCDWEQLIEELDGLIADDDYEWALETTEGIRETVADREHATDRQCEVMENIRDRGR